jgi:uncharacterized membrane protein YhaH (DUF805 family)
MVKELWHRVRPALRTNRRDYWLFCCAYCGAYVVFLLLMRAIATYQGPQPSPFLVGGPILPMVVLGIVALLVTIRRLRDAGSSPWWVLLFFFPFKFSLNLFSADFGPIHIHDIEFHDLITNIPVFIGLLKPSQSRAAISI